MTACQKDCGECVRLVIEQPPDDREFVTPDGVFIKELYIRDAGTVVPQHSHAYAHTSYLVRGSVRLWADTMLIGDFSAPKPILIAAAVKHTFQSLEPDTTILCVHNLNGAEKVSILEHHQLEGSH